MKKNQLKIIDQSEIKYTTTGNYYVKVCVEDQSSGDKIWLNAFGDKENKEFPEAVKDFKYKNKLFPGRIAYVDVDEDLIEEAMSAESVDSYVKVSSFKMIIWDDDSWDSLSERQKIVKSIRSQLWKLRPKYRNKRKTSRGKTSNTSVNDKYPIEQPTPTREELIERNNNPANNPSENPWIEVLGDNQQARDAYWNTD